DLMLPGASPDHKDIYVQADWMDCARPGSDCGDDVHDEKPFLAALQRVQEVFAAAPVSNPDGTTGVRLHLELGQAVPHHRLVDVGCFHDPEAVKFAALKAASLGPSNPRRFTHRYVLFGHAQSDLDRGSAGCAERPGNDLLVTLDSWKAR